MINHEIAKSVSEFTSLPLSEVETLLARPKSPDHGDLSLPCFNFAKTWGIKPNEAAQKIKDSITLPDSFSEAEVVGPYLNFRVNRPLFAKTILTEILKDGINFKKSSPNKRKVLLEFSSVNIAKTLHVGHLRTTLIGAALDRIFRYKGFDVVSINHLGDWGTQFGFVWAGVQLFGMPENPTLDDIVDLYIKASTLRKQQDENKVPAEYADKPNANQMARDYFIKLEAGDKEAENFWKWSIDVSMEYLDKVYKRLNVHFDNITGESFYRHMLTDVEQKIKDSGVLEKSEGALGVELDKELGFVRIFTEDGRSLYITRDIAAAMYRHDTFKPERNVYVVGAQQSLHFKQLIGVMEKLKHPSAKEIVHVAYGWVPGMKTREGGAISLTSFLDEMKERALTAYNSEVSKRPENLNEDTVSEQVAIGATYFYMLNHSNIKDLQFSWEKALTFQGDSGPYVQYALGRLNSILKNASENNIKLSSEIDFNLITDNESHELIKSLSKFEEALNYATETYEPMVLCHFALEVARNVARAYKQLRVVGEEQKLAEARLALFKSARDLLYRSLDLIGVPPIERM